MRKKTIKIDESRCNACCLCVSACSEGAIGLIGGKAKLLNDTHCNEFGRCLAVCPTKAITFEEVEENDDDVDLISNNIENKLKSHANMLYSRTSKLKTNPEPEQEDRVESHLNQWPIQIKLIPSNASYFNKANLLIAADCSAYVYSNFHAEYMKDRITIICCPKLDDEDYSEKLAAIFRINDIKSVTVVRMEVPCCNEMESAVSKALSISGKTSLIPSKFVTISTSGKLTASAVMA